MDNNPYVCYRKSFVNHFKSFPSPPFSMGWISMGDVFQKLGSMMLWKIQKGDPLLYVFFMGGVLNYPPSPTLPFCLRLCLGWLIHDQYLSNWYSPIILDKVLWFKLSICNSSLKMLWPWSRTESFGQIKFDLLELEFVWMGELWNIEKMKCKKSKIIHSLDRGPREFLSRSPRPDWLWNIAKGQLMGPTGLGDEPKDPTGIWYRNGSMLG